MQKVIAKIHLTNIRQNAEAFKKISCAKLCAVVKANAYGHGAEEVTLALTELADMYAVALIEEGIAIRAAACGKDILVFTPPVGKEEAYALIVNGFLVSVPNLYTAKLLSSVCKTYGLCCRVHLKVNTGMNRYGMNPSALGKVCKLLKEDPFVRVEGIYSHLYECKRETAEEQRARFAQMLRIGKGYFPSLIAHLGATYGAQLGKEYAFDMVRVGLGLYGYSPVPTTLPLRPAMEVTGRALLTRKYSYGGVGYGDNRTEKGEKLTLLSGGYADGFLRKRENGTSGFTQNVCPLCMDVCIRKGEKKRGASVSLLRNADEVAAQTGTVAYEVLCAATRRAELIYEE